MRSPEIIIRERPPLNSISDEELLSLLQCTDFSYQVSAPIAMETARRLFVSYMEKKNA